MCACCLHITQKQQAKEDNDNEHVITHVDIDVGDILNLTYNLSPHPSFLLERIARVIFGKFAIAIPSLIVVFNVLSHHPSPCEKVGGAFSFGLSL